MKTIREKIYQMFILGLSGDNLNDNPHFLKALKNNLGGVIFFTQNITTKEKFTNLIKDIKSVSKTPPFLSIDQEGGRVERTLNLHNGQKYLNARESAKKGEKVLESQTKQIANELNSFGINMNFAPVLDVDTNPNNPIIAERSYSSDPDEVIKYAKISADIYTENKIVPVGKHFPGHGETAVDSHKDMPELTLSIEDLEKTHIKPFKTLIQQGLPAVMIAHIHYSAFDEEKIPASISENIINGYLREKLNFSGLVISDDMVMGGIKGFSSIDACLRGIEAGINMFIFRDCNEDRILLIEKLVEMAEEGKIDLEKIDFSIKKIAECKSVL